jgi:ABC-type branched-subunit amino acid transport system substrate-binding protein/DNA-binding beta-propeller fold protein YncE
MSPALTPGATFAGYRIESQVGRGGMGVVYRATDTSLERPVALKLIAPELADDERFRARFLKEPRLAASLDHPSVVPIYEAGERDGQLYLAMRYVEGSDLGTILRRDGKLSPERALPILGQIAAALDAAHRRGLVHRDVKPANVLLDQDGHAYLTDFGITKRIGGASTDTGHVVGTLDYLAPEQIRGDSVDARTDCYALACVLYECLTGAPPFRRETEAETMWAHMQEEPAPVRGHPALDPVLRRALAKEKNERPATCSELIDESRRALGLAVPAKARQRRISPTLLRRRRAVFVAGLLVLAGAIAAGAVALTSGGGGSEAPVGNGVAAIGPRSGEVESFIESATAPSNIAVGEGAVWFLSTQDETVTRLDPKTKAVTGRLRTRGVPTDIAAGAGAIWVGNGGGGITGGGSANYTVSISRIDPKTSKTTHTLKLPSRAPADAVATFNWGFPNIVVADGAVWARNPDHTVSRIDPETGRLVEVIDVAAGGSIAAGKEGVWFIDDEGPSVVRIDPRTNRPGQRIPVGAQEVRGIAVGAGSVWTTAEREGLVWRIQPGPSPVTRTIDVGPGVTYIAYGAGAVWAANFIDGTVSRIDPRTNSVTARIPIGAAQALAAGAGSAWVSTAGGTQAGGLPDTACGQLETGGREPDVLIASDLPLQGPDGTGPRAMADAIRHVLRQRGFRAGKYAVGYRSCDDSTAQTGAYENRRCAANANAYAQAKELVAVIGPFNSGCAQIEVPIVNRAPDGPVAMIGPTLTHPGLTRGGTADSYRGEPEVYYPTGVRNLVLLKPGEDVQGAAHAVLARRLGLEGVYVLDDGSGLQREAVSDPFRRTARRLGVDIAGSAAFDPLDASYAALAARVARSGAEGVVVGAGPFEGGDRLIRALRARLGDRVTIMAGFFFAFAPEVLEVVGPAARGMYVTTLDLPLTALPMTAAGRRFARDVGALDNPTYGVLEAGQSAELALDAIARSDGTRASILEELRASVVKNGIIGSFRFDRNGDTTTASVPILRITGSTPPGSGLPANFQGAVVDRVVEVPASLAR